MPDQTDEPTPTPIFPSAVPPVPDADQPAPAPDPTAELPPPPPPAPRGGRARLREGAVVAQLDQIETELKAHTAQLVLLGAMVALVAGMVWKSHRELLSAVNELEGRS